MENVTLGKFNEFECQVSPGHDNLQHSQLRARAKLNVLGEKSCNNNPPVHTLRCPVHCFTHLPCKWNTVNGGQIRRKAFSIEEILHFH